MPAIQLKQLFGQTAELAAIPTKQKLVNIN